MHGQSQISILENPVGLWETFKSETLEVAMECIVKHLRSKGDFISKETVASIEESYTARLAGNHDAYRALSSRTTALLTRDNESYGTSLAKDVEGHLNAYALRSPYRKKLCTKPGSQVSTIHSADGCCATDMDGQRVQWIECLKELCTEIPPSGWL